MGNTLFNNRIQEEEESIKVYLDIKQTKLQLNQNIKGRVIFKFPIQIQGLFDLHLKIYGIENGYYNFTEKNKKMYQYSVKDFEFFEKTISLVQNERIQVDQYWEVPFDWNPVVQIPSLDYKYSSDLIFSREYMVEAILICKNQRNKKILQKCQQRVLFYIDSDQLKEQARQMKEIEVKKNQKVEAITTYKWFRQQKGLVFISFEADKCIYFNGDYLNVTAEVDNTFGHLNILSAKILFYLEFIIKEKILQGMPKILLCEEQLQITEQNKFFGKMNFQLNDRLNLPYQSVSERIGCRCIVVLQVIFEQLCMGSGVDNVEIILPYMEYYRDNKNNAEPELECLTEIKNIENCKVLMEAKQQYVSERPAVCIKDQEFLTNNQTRVAQQTQILIQKE